MAKAQVWVFGLIQTLVPLVLLLYFLQHYWLLGGHFL